MASHRDEHRVELLCAVLEDTRVDVRPHVSVAVRPDVLVSAWVIMAWHHWSGYELHAVLEPVGGAVGRLDVGVVQEAVDYGGGQDVVAQDAAPFGLKCPRWPGHLE